MNGYKTVAITLNFLNI